MPISPTYLHKRCQSLLFYRFFVADELGGEHPRADPTEIVPSIIIRPIGGVAPSAQELPVPPSIPPAA